MVSSYQIKLSPYHKMFYNEWKIAPRSAAYNIVFDQTLSGNLDGPRLRQALNRFIADYVLMNSHIQEIADEVYWVKNPTILELELFEGAYVKEQIFEYVSRPFDLEKGPLYRFGLFPEENGDVRFVVVLHHVLIDGVSFDNFIEEISLYYNNIFYNFYLGSEEQIYSLTETTDHFYKNLTQHETQHKNFWHSLLLDVEPVDLRFLKSNKNKKQESKLKKNSSVSEIRFKYKKEDLIRVKSLKSIYGVTPYFYSQCIFSLVIQKYTGQNNFSISYPVATRKDLNFAHGAKINTIISVYTFDDNTTIANLFSQAKKSGDLIKDNELNYIYFSINNILAEINHNVLDVFFIQSNLKDSPFHFIGAEVRKINHDYNIDLSTKLLWEQEIKNDFLNFRIRYNSNEFDEIILEKFVSAYHKIFFEVLEDLEKGLDNKIVHEYSPLSAEEYQQIVFDWNKTECVYPRDKTIHQLFEEQVDKYPNNIALVYEEKKITYQELNQRANQLAYYLKYRYQLKIEELIILCFDRSEYLVIGILSTLKCGAAYVCLNIQDYKTRFLEILYDTNSRLILTDEAYIEKFDSLSHTINFSTKFLIVNDFLFRKKINNFSVLNLDNVVKSDHLSHLIYTSGTTGKPKGVMIKHRGVVSLVCNVNYININAEDNVFFLSNVAFDAMTFEIWSALLNGGTLVIPTDHMELMADLSSFRKYLNIYNISIMLLTPSLFNHLYSHDKCLFKKIKYLLVGGESLNIFFMRELVNSNYTPKYLINAYGPAENTTISCSYHIQKYSLDRKNSVPIGVPLTNRKAYVLNNHGKPLPVGAIGELYVGGEGLASGYLNLPELTRERFITNQFQNDAEIESGENKKLYKTGDLVRWSPDGDLEYIGRNDFQVKISGYRINLNEIELKFVGYPGISQAVVKLKNDIFSSEYYSSEKYLIAYYLAEEAYDENDLKNYLAQYFPHYMLPNIFVHLKNLPVTANGKLDASSLSFIKIKKKSLYVAPTNSKEYLICDYFCKSLHLEKIGIYDDFFNIGGNSIRAISLVSSLRRHFNVTVSDIFLFKTPHQIALNIQFGRNFIKEKLIQERIFYQNIKKNKQIYSDDSKEKIKLYLKSCENLCLEVSSQKSIKNVLLTGATGYLGCYLLHQILTLTNYRVHLLVRAETTKRAFDRINQKFKFYFSQNLEESYQSRVVVLKADIELEKFGLSNLEYNILSSIIDSVIHSAALVSHYGDYEKFYSANVQSTKYLLDFSLLIKNKDFHYISTYSILDSRYMTESEEFLYTEDDIPLDLENYQSVYVKTKLEGEHQILSYRQRGISANIYRVGNLAFDSKSGRPQEKILENAFNNWIIAILKLKYISTEIGVVEISPVDMVARAVVKIFDKIQLKNGTYHVFNPFYFNFASFLGSHSRYGCTVLPLDQLIESLIALLERQNDDESIVKIFIREGLLDHENKKINRKIKILQNRTQNILKALDFEWAHVENSVFYNYLEYLLEKFL